VNNYRSSGFWFGRTAHNIFRGLLVALAAVAVASITSAQDKKDEVSFDLFIPAGVVDCLRAKSYEEPRARATVVRGEFNDTMILDLDGVKPGLPLALFTLERTIFQADGELDPNRKGVRIKTVLLDQIFGFDPDVALPPTNTFHVGLWFDNPNDAVACHFDPTKTTPFNGEHQAGPLAMVSLPDAKTGLGPLCTDPNTSTTPASCNP